MRHEGDTDDIRYFVYFIPRLMKDTRQCVHNLHQNTTIHCKSCEMFAIILVNLYLFCCNYQHNSLSYHCLT